MALRPSRLAVLAALALALAGCGGDGASVDGAGEPVSFEQLVDAASSSADATSGRFSFGFELSAPGADESFAFTGEGAFDAASERAALTIDMSSFAALLGGVLAGLGGTDAPDFDDPGAWTIDVVQDGAVSYVRFPALASRLPAGKSWIRAEEGDDPFGGGAQLEGLDELTEADPRELLEAFRGASGEVEVVGAETVRGAETTHYRATLDPSSIESPTSDDDGRDLHPLADDLLAQSGVDEIPLDLWVDDDGLVRKLVLDVSATQAGASEPARAAITFELWDLGATVDVELPPSSEVADASELRG